MLRGQTSFRYGAEACAPSRVTDIAAALFAKVTASFIPFPSAKAIARAPLKTSPAAVESTASTFIPRIIPVNSSDRTYAP